MNPFGWWTGLIDHYAWRALACWLLPAMVLLVAVVFRAVRHMHLHGGAIELRPEKPQNVGEDDGGRGKD